MAAKGVAQKRLAIVLLGIFIAASCGISRTPGAAGADADSPPPESSSGEQDTAAVPPLSPEDFILIRQKDGLSIRIAGQNAGPSLLRALGAPERKERRGYPVETNALGLRTAYGNDAWYSGLWIRFVDDPEGCIWWITATGPGYRTPRGIGIGSTEAELKAAYGEALLADWGPKTEKPSLYRGLVQHYMTYGFGLYDEDFRIVGESNPFFTDEVFMLFLLDKEDRINLIEIVRPL